MSAQPFSSTRGQELLTRVRSAGYARDADVLQFRELLESDHVDGDFALAALRTLADRELQHFNDERGSASLELQLRAMTAALAAIRSTISKFSHNSHKGLQSSISKLDEFCSRDLRLHNNPNVEFLMRKVKKDTLSLSNDTTKTDIAMNVGLAIGSAALAMYGRDLLGAIDALQTSSLEWNQTWDAFLTIAQSFTANTSVFGSPSSQDVDAIVAKTVAAYESTQVQRSVNSGSELFAGRGSLMAFELMDAFQQRYSATRDASLVAPACDVASSYLADEKGRHNLRFKALELLNSLGEKTEAKAAIWQAEIRINPETLRTLRSDVAIKIAQDSVLLQRIQTDKLSETTHAISKVAFAPSAYPEPATTTNGTRKFADGSTYVGSEKDGQFHGEGVFTRPNGERRAGTFENGFLEGRGEVDYANGDRREGLFRAGRLRQGVLILASKQRHEGDFDINGKLTRGTIKSGNGDIRKGNFADDKLEGQGEHIFPSGQRRKGAFKDGFLHGEGKVWYEDGKYREGTFLGGRHRKGTLILPSKDRHVGEFDEDRKLRKGSIVSADGTVQTGTFEDGKLTGNGVLVYSNGQIREGVFKGGYLHGDGKVSYQNGDYREGRFEGGRHREGLLIQADGVHFRGCFNMNGKLDGHGSMTLPNSKEFIGEFSDGVGN
ncbi:unnamed protein product [Clonostachys rosea]|uniref:Uncharacterized protein n=1 Tax=Bionectria ochroleuca TaxID=29856 RepID=A0ABY6UBB6_BIOOC|nr:unnamed protein product [Clonostachys rosea]